MVPCQKVFKPSKLRSNSYVPHAQVVERHVPKEWNHNCPHNHTVRTKRADTVERLELQPGYEQDTKQYSSLHTQPIPAFECRTGQQSRANSQHDSKSGYPKQRIRKAKHACLGSINDRPAGNNRINITTKRMIRVFEQCYFFYKENRRSEQSDKSCYYHNKRQCNRQSSAFEFSEHTLGIIPKAAWLPLKL